MRYIVTCRLRNGYDAYVITNETSSSNAIKKVCNNSKRMDKEFEAASNDCSVHKLDTKQDNRKANNRLFDYCLIDISGQIHTGVIKGHGVKTAYNNLMDKQKVSYRFVYLMDSDQRKKMRKQHGEKSTSKAKDVLKSKGQTVALFSKAMEKSEAIQGVPILKEVSLMFNMVVDYMQGNYKEVPFGTIVGVTAAVIYFVSPVDFIPDFIPGLGQMDDVGAIMLAIKYAKKDLIAYEAWKNSKNSKNGQSRQNSQNTNKQGSDNKKKVV